MTRNVYLGVDIQRPIRATAGKTGLDALVALGSSNVDTRAIEDRTNFPRRSELLAGEIAEAQARSRRPPGGGSLAQRAPRAATALRRDAARHDQLRSTVDYDYLQLLLQDLRQEGVPYKAVVVQDEMDPRVRRRTRQPRPRNRHAGPRHPAHDARRDPAAREQQPASDRQGQCAVRHQGSGQRGRLAPSEIIRGYGWVDVAKGSARPFRFVEHPPRGVQLARCSRTSAGAAGRDNGRRPNHRDRLRLQLRPPRRAGPRRRTRPDPALAAVPSSSLVAAAGFTDMWLKWRPADQGWTSGLNETVDEARTRELDAPHRHDLRPTRTRPAARRGRRRGHRRTRQRPRIRRRDCGPPTTRAWC